MEIGPGHIVVLNGAPRSGKSSIAAAIQGAFDAVRMNLGVDVVGAATPERFRPGLGLRPGGERPDLEALLPALYAGLHRTSGGASALAAVETRDRWRRAILEVAPFDHPLPTAPAEPAERVHRWLDCEASAPVLSFPLQDRSGEERSRDHIVGMENSAPSLTPDGQRAVTFLLLV